MLRALLDGLSNNEFETWESDGGNDLESFLSLLITSQCPRFTHAYSNESWQQL